MRSRESGNDTGPRDVQLKNDLFPIWTSPSPKSTDSRFAHPSNAPLVPRFSLPMYLTPRNVTLRIFELPNVPSAMTVSPSPLIVRCIAAFFGYVPDPPLTMRFSPLPITKLVIPSHM